MGWHNCDLRVTLSTTPREHVFPTNACHSHPKAAAEIDIEYDPLIASRYANNCQYKLQKEQGEYSYSEASPDVLASHGLKQHRQIPIFLHSVLRNEGSATTMLNWMVTRACGRLFVSYAATLTVEDKL